VIFRKYRINIVSISCRNGKSNIEALLVLSSGLKHSEALPCTF